MSSPHNRTGYYVIQKFDDGWLIGSQLDDEPIYLHHSSLVEMGYLPKNTLKTNITPKSNAIVVPTGNSPPKGTGGSRADQDPYWRKK